MLVSLATVEIRLLFEPVRWAAAGQFTLLAEVLWTLELLELFELVLCIYSFNYL